MVVESLRRDKPIRDHPSAAHQSCRRQAQGGDLFVIQDNGDDTLVLLGLEYLDRANEGRLVLRLFSKLYGKSASNTPVRPVQRTVLIRVVWTAIEVAIPVKQVNAASRLSLIGHRLGVSRQRLRPAVRLVKEGA